MSINIQKAETSAHFRLLDELAHAIWREHYPAIIGHEQVEYMLDKFQSVEAMQKQVGEGYEYYLLFEGEKAVGYFSFLQEKEVLFLSKVYVLAELRGKGVGRQAMDFIENQARKRQLNGVRLTVNKYNTKSIETYLKMGFKRVRDVVIVIGGGFVMDDYEMLKKL